jgi:hypothetical protein
MTGNWDTTSNILKYKGSNVVLHGFALTTLQYLLRGIGTSSYATYNWNDASNIITTINETELTAISNFLLPASQGIMPAARICLNASYYLGVITNDWSDAASKYPNLSTQYQTLLDNIITFFTSKGIVVILDLHWNDSILMQQSMALKPTSNQTTGDSVDFFDTLSKKYGSNDLVLYELYNEPYAGQDIWLNGDDSHYGMIELYNTVRNNTNNPVIIGGASDYAYDSASLIQFDNQVKPINVIYNFHPYMGPYQAGDPTKLPINFKNNICQIQSLNRPVILTELGQYCCGNSNCYLYTGTYNGTSMGYVNAILEIAKEMNISWTIWAWRPNGGFDCAQPDVNSGDSLAAPSANCTGNTGCGADFVSLWKTYYSQS